MEAFTGTKGQQDFRKHLGRLNYTMYELAAQITAVKALFESYKDVTRSQADRAEQASTLQAAIDTILISTEDALEREAAVIDCLGLAFPDMVRGKDLNELRISILEGTVADEVPTADLVGEFFRYFEEWSPERRAEELEKVKACVADPDLVHVLTMLLDDCSAIHGREDGTEKDVLHSAGVG